MGSCRGHGARQKLRTEQEGENPIPTPHPDTTPGGWGHPSSVPLTRIKRSYQYHQPAWPVAPSMPLPSAPSMPIPTASTHLHSPHGLTHPQTLASVGCAGQSSGGVRGAWQGRLCGHQLSRQADGRAWGGLEGSRRPGEPGARGLWLQRSPPAPRAAVLLLPEPTPAGALQPDTQLPPEPALLQDPHL